MDQATEGNAINCLPINVLCNTLKIKSACTTSPLLLACHCIPGDAVVLAACWSVCSHAGDSHHHRQHDHPLAVCPATAHINQI